MERKWVDENAQNWDQNDRRHKQTRNLTVGDHHTNRDSMSGNKDENRVNKWDKKWDLGSTEILNNRYERTYAHTRI